MDFIQITEIQKQQQVSQQHIPSKIFIVPYRNRIQHKFFFSKYMTFLLEDEAPGDYEIYFSHQSDTKPFNRGAAKNIGFLAMKQKYPNDYKDITFIFNDVDTVPFNKIFNYDTTCGVVQHLYGFKFALGGIVIFKGADFEKINGYPNYWGWGMEDNVIQHRCNNHQLVIDRSQFVPIGCQDILQMFDGIKRIVTRYAVPEAVNDTGVDGLRSIRNLLYTIDFESSNDNDNNNVNSVENPYIYYINIHSFLTLTSPEDKNLETYDLRSKPRKINDYEYPAMAMQINTQTAQQRQKQTNVNSHTNVKTNVNIYSPEYAKIMNVKERATTSVNIGMGGLMKK
jgi:hypothetical protein